MKLFDSILSTTCADDEHDFVRSPKGFLCQYCGLKLPWDSQLISKYIGSSITGTYYRWDSWRMHQDNIASFSISAEDCLAFEISCDFTHLCIRNCLKDNRDGWMQSHFPKDYFEPRNIPLTDEDCQQLRDLLGSFHFSNWETPIQYIKNYYAPGFSVKKSFTCKFSEYEQFTSLKPDNAEFEDLVSLIQKIARTNVTPEDRDKFQKLLAFIYSQTILHEMPLDPILVDEPQPEPEPDNDEWDMDFN